MQEGLQLGPEEAAALRAALAAAELRAEAAEANAAYQTARAATAEAKLSNDAALIAHLKLQIPHPC